jgi:uncharacterized membrane protein YdbT with pleckstrin-like domain
MGFKVPTAGGQRQAAAAKQSRAADKQAKDMAEANRRLKEQLEADRAMAEAMPMAAPPEAQELGGRGEDGDRRMRRSSMRGSLLAGNTGGYNPATGGGKLGGRGLLG